jgi:stringent starvation protein B
VTNKNYYLINAIYQWCIDSHLTPHILVVNNEDLISQLPKNYSSSKELIFNISNTAVKNLIIGNNNVEFNAMFNGTVCLLNIDIKNILYIFAKEVNNGVYLEHSLSKIKTENNKKETHTSKSHLTLIK